MLQNLNPNFDYNQGLELYQNKEICAHKLRANNMYLNKQFNMRKYSSNM